MADNNELLFRKSEKDELDTVYRLYQSVKGTEFCVWDDEYPGMAEINHDYETGNLFVLIKNGEVAGALSVVPENEMDQIDVWDVRDGAEIGRIVVAPTNRGNGFAGLMVGSVIKILKDRKKKAVHISAAKVNIPALKTYYKLGFENKGEKFMYGNMYCLLEKKI